MVKPKQTEAVRSFLYRYPLLFFLSLIICYSTDKFQIFYCFTGLAFVDIKGLQLEHVINGNNGEMWIRKPRVKTNNMCNIPLLRIPKMLLEKYSNDKGCELTKQLLPVPTNQKMNAYLKEVADICGISKRLTTHCAGHKNFSFALIISSLR